MKLAFNTDDLVNALKWRKILRFVIVAAIAFLIFHAGVVVGSHRHFSERGFGLQRGNGFFIAHMPQGFIHDGHGALGVVSNMGATSFTLTGRDGSAQRVIMSEDTAIKSMDGGASSSALKNGQHIIVLGTPGDDGTISARLIHIMPSPPSEVR